MPVPLPRLLDPIDRVAEILFGLIMAVTIIGSLSVATARSRRDPHRASRPRSAANLAWGLVDAVMYVVRATTSRVREANLGQGDGTPILTWRLFAEAIVVFRAGRARNLPGGDSVPADRRRRASRCGISRAVTIALLVRGGFQLGRHAGYARPWLAGAFAALFGGRADHRGDGARRMRRIAARARRAAFWP
jgi:hypothetical protein